MHINALGKCLPWTCSKTVPGAQRPEVSMISGLALLLTVRTPGVMGAATLSWAPTAQGRILTRVAQGGLLSFWRLVSLSKNRAASSYPPLNWKYISSLLMSGAFAWKTVFPVR